MSGAAAARRRRRRRVLEACAVAAVASGFPSAAWTLVRERSVAATLTASRDATRAIGTLLPPGRPGLLRGAAVHAAVSLACAEGLARTLPQERSIAWGAAAGLIIGTVNLAVIGRVFPAIRALPLLPQIADNVMFGVLFAAVADRP